MAVHINIRSLGKNFESLEFFVAQLRTKPHIIMISETWLDSSPAQSFDLEGYWFEHSTQNEFRGKGAGVFVHKSLPYVRRYDLDSNLTEFQTVFIELNIQNQPLITGTIYRSPSYPPLPFIDNLESVLNVINRERKLCVIGGDLNIDILKHLTHLTAEPSSLLLNTMAALGFLPCISLPTRLTSHSKTLIDNFFCNEISLVNDPIVIMADLSDHLPIAMHLQMRIACRDKANVMRNVFDFRKVDSLKRNLSNRLNNFCSILDAEQSCNALSHALKIEIANHSIKQGNRRTVPIRPWISYDLLRRINKKNALHKKFVLFPTESNHINFKTYRNDLKSMIRASKKAYFDRKLEETSSQPKKNVGCPPKRYHPKTKEKITSRTLRN